MLEDSSIAVSSSWIDHTTGNRMGQSSSEARLASESLHKDIAYNIFH